MSVYGTGGGGFAAGPGVEFLAGGSVVGHEDVSGGEKTAVVGPAAGEDVALPEILEVGWWRRRLPAEEKAGVGEFALASAHQVHTLCTISGYFKTR